VLDSAEIPSVSTDHEPHVPIHTGAVSTPHPAEPTAVVNADTISVEMVSEAHEASLQQSARLCSIFVASLLYVLVLF